MSRREADRRRYQLNAESRAKQRERQNRWWRDKYANDPEFRAQHDAKRREHEWLHRGLRFPSI